MKEGLSTRQLTQRLLILVVAMFAFGFALVPATWWLLYRTRFGLRLRAVGENPASVDTAGVSVTRLRYGAVLICGALCGIAGAYLATAISAGFVKEMTAGRGCSSRTRSSCWRCICNCCCCASRACGLRGCGTPMRAPSRSA